MPSKHVQPFFNGLPADADVVGPLGHGQCLAESRDKAIAGDVVSLLLGSSPSNVSGPVVAVAVDPVNGMHIGWAGANRRKKFGETGKFNGNASSSVKTPILIVGVAAPVLHAPIRRVFRRVRCAMALFLASARGGHASFEGLRVNRKGDTTITQAQPFGFAFDRRGHRGSNEPAKSASGEVFSFHEVSNEVDN